MPKEVRSTRRDASIYPALLDTMNRSSRPFLEIASSAACDAAPFCIDDDEFLRFPAPCCWIREKDSSTGEQGWWATEWLADRLQLWWRQQLPTNLPTPASGHVICHIKRFAQTTSSLHAERICSYVLSRCRAQRDKLPFLFFFFFFPLLSSLFFSFIPRRVSSFANRKRSENITSFYMPSLVFFFFIIRIKIALTLENRNTSLKVIKRDDVDTYSF